MFVCTLVLISYFFVTAGVAYDIINEPPAVGATTDPVTGARSTPERSGTAWAAERAPLGVGMCVPFGTLPAAARRQGGK